MGEVRDRRVRGLLAVLGSIALAACSDSGPSDANGGGGRGASESAGRLPGYDGPSLPATPGSLPADQLGDAFENILCHALIECEGAVYPDAEVCAADRAPGGLQDVLDGIADGSLEYDADAMGDCRRLFEANLCALSGAFLLVPSAHDVVELCRGTQGKRAAGEPCRSGLECGSDSFCDRSTGCPGTCRTKLTVGAACFETVECAPLTPPPNDLSLAYILEHAEELQREYESSRVRCEDGACRASSRPGDRCPRASEPAGSSPSCVGELTFCDGALGQCVARHGAGDACADDEQCEEPLFCEGVSQPPSTTAPGTCQRRNEQGGSCTQLSHCAPGLRCLQRTAQGLGHCAPRSATSGPCDFANDCEPGLGCNEGNCAPLPGAGAPCSQGNCAAGLDCTDASLCAEVVLPGEACDPIAQVCIGVCAAGMCQPRAALGAACTEGPECTTRDCRDGRCIDGELCVNLEL